MKTNKFEYDYESIFSNIEVKPLVPVEKDEYLALASMEKIGKLIPDIDINDNIDLLPIAFNACVVNRVNRNGDVVDSKTAVAMAKNFLNKQINIEHDRKRVIGVILKVGFSEFGTDEPIDEIKASEETGPFNITLGGVIWKTVNSNIANLVEDASDPTSENYMKVSASWELGFKEFEIVLLDEGEKNISNAQTISESAEVIKNEKYLKSRGGAGKNEQGKMVYRKVVGKVLPLGIGLTENPAADVAGVATLTTASNVEENAINSSQYISTDVNNNIINKIMKIEKLEDINDSLLKEVQASVITDFIQDKLKQASEQFVEEKTLLEAQIKEANSKLEELLNNHSSVVDELDKLKTQVAEREAEERFTVRMAKFDEEFELSAEDRSIIASEISDLDEESFEKYSNKMRVLMSSKLKSSTSNEEVSASASRIREIERQAAEKQKAEAVSESSQPVEETVEEAAQDVADEAADQVEEDTTEEVIEQAVDQADMDDEVIANSTSTQPKSYKEKYAKAFTFDGFNIKL